jgi:hypothetical protein
MDRWRWNRLPFGRRAGVGRTTRRISRNKLGPGCEVLDCRQLLSGATVVLPVPPATAVSNAAAILEALDPPIFARLQADMARAEGHSHVSPAQAAKLAGDEVALDQLVQAAGLDSSDTARDKNDVQDAVDEAFHPTLDRAETWAKDRRTLEAKLSNVPGGAPLISLTINQVHLVARATRVTGPFQRVLAADEQILTANLGPNPDADLGPGAVNRDPLVVYYNGQVNSFIK